VFNLITGIWKKHFTDVIVVIWKPHNLTAFLAINEMHNSLFQGWIQLRGGRDKKSKKVCNGSVQLIDLLSVLELVSVKLTENGTK
jgi:hypothetical protein